MTTTIDPPENDAVTQVAALSGAPTHAAEPTAPREDRPREVRGRSLDDWATLAGSGAASLCLVWLLYNQVLPFSGKVGFFICWYVLFVAFYAGLTALSHPKPIVIDRLASAVVHGAAGLVAIALGSTILYTYWKGWPAYKHGNFFTSDMGSVNPGTSPLTHGGIKHVLVGSLIQIGIAVVISLPLGMATAVYMTEVGGRLSRAVRTVVEAMTALPDLVAGLFVYAVFVIAIGGAIFNHTGVTVALALSITMLPIIARSAEVVLRGVPSGLREASWALGSSQWRTVLRVVLPTAKAGLGTALILGVARGIGETAPLIIVSGTNPSWNANPIRDPMNSLPFFIYTGVRSGQPSYVTRAYGAAAVLLTLVLILFVAVRVLARERRGR